MNIGQMVRGLLGDVKSGDAKQLELKPGQVVRGVVTEVSEDGQEAVLNINGTQVKAKLETPLAPGQSTMLQVQPETEQGLVVLKPLQSSPGVPIAEQSLGDVLKSVGLPDQKWARELIQLMQQNGVPITKETAEQMRAVMAQVPQGVSQEDWMQASALAFKRGLPLTQETVKALHQVLFGKPLTQLLATLQLQLADALEQQPAAPQASRGAGEAPPPAAGGAPTAAPAPASLGGARAGAAPLLLTQAAAVLQELAAAAQPAAAPSAAGTAAAPAPAQAAPGANAPSAAAQGLGAPASQGAPSGAAASSAAAAVQGQAAPAEPGAARPVNVAAQQTSAPLATPQAAASAASTQPLQTSSAPAQQGGAALNTDANPAQVTSTPVSTEGEGQPHKAIQEPWIGRVLKLLGVEHEQTAWKTLEVSNLSQGTAAKGSEPAALMHNPNIGSGTQAAQEIARWVKPSMELPLQGMPLPHATGTAPAQASPDTLKQVLLQLIQSDDVPPVLKDTAQQLVNQITGQQLMLSNDRSAPFAHVSLFIPLKNAEGEETATVHIQTRKGKRGELDAGNCHLWFDLNLRALGRTIADVSVVDRIVSLKLLNDQEWLAPMVQERRPEIEAVLAEIGYQLISLQTAPVPVKQDHSKSSAALGEQPASAYTPPDYKGVDLLV
ncbi:DNA ligase [Paenibacillus guangzhouensis]|uniref:DNA ligase n=1 Tax=Paenibacillus guangzhouensis TaxID=1473112 RepID=UPI001266975A|nr:DNA ligase [Paenibacillus guangzhouensis]